jgi:hypothetical protein
MFRFMRMNLGFSEWRGGTLGDWYAKIRSGSGAPSRMDLSGLARVAPALNRARRDGRPAMLHGGIEIQGGLRDSIQNPGIDLE